MFLIRKHFLQIKKTAEKGFGIFAKKDISAGTVIGDYLGKVIKTAEYDLDKDKDGLYLMYYSDLAAIYPNLKKPGIHLINHSCTPNCRMYFYKGHTLFFALRKIKASHELTISYMLSPKNNCTRCTHICKCNSKFCTGTMHSTKVKYEKWQKFQNNQKRETKIPKAVFGKILPKLSSYPEIVPQSDLYRNLAL